MILFKTNIDNIVKALDACAEKGRFNKLNFYPGTETKAAFSSGNCLITALEMSDNRILVRVQSVRPCQTIQGQDSPIRLGALSNEDGKLWNEILSCLRTNFEEMEMNSSWIADDSLKKIGQAAGGVVEARPQTIEEALGDFFSNDRDLLTQVASAESDGGGFFVSQKETIDDKTLIHHSQEKRLLDRILETLRNSPVSLIRKPKAHAFLDTSQDMFCNWLAHKTDDVYNYSFPTQKGRIDLDRARQKQLTNRQLVMVMKGNYIYLKPEAPEIEISRRVSVIEFSLIPISSNRLEITGVCRQNVCIKYFVKLLELIEEAYPATKGMTMNYLAGLAKVLGLRQGVGRGFDEQVINMSVVNEISNTDETKSIEFEIPKPDETERTLADASEEELRTLLKSDEIQQAFRELGELAKSANERIDKVPMGIIRPLIDEAGGNLNKIPLNKLFKVINDFEVKEKPRKRGPSADTLAKCQEAMRLWLDEDKSLTKAANLAGIDPKTAKRRIPNVMQMINKDKKEVWTKKLEALEIFP